MCDAKPGLRCSADTCGRAGTAVTEYETAFPGGPTVNPVDAVTHAMAQLEEAEAPVRAAVEAANRKFTTVGAATRIKDTAVQDALATSAQDREAAQQALTAAKKAAAKAQKEAKRAAHLAAYEAQRRASEARTRQVYDKAQEITATIPSQPDSANGHRHLLYAREKEIRAAANAGDLAYLEAMEKNALHLQETAANELRKAYEAEGVAYPDGERTVAVDAVKTAWRPWTDEARLTLSRIADAKRDVADGVRVIDSAVRHLQPGDVIGDQTVRCTPYRGMRTPSGRNQLELTGPDPRTGETVTRTVEWNASTIIRNVRRPGLPHTTARAVEPVPYEPGVFEYRSPARTPRPFPAGPDASPVSAATE